MTDPDPTTSSPTAYISRFHGIQHRILTNTLLISTPAVVLWREGEREGERECGFFSTCGVTSHDTQKKYSAGTHLAFHLLLSSICVELIPFPEVGHDEVLPCTSPAGVYAATKEATQLVLLSPPFPPGGFRVFSTKKVARDVGTLD